MPRKPCLVHGCPQYADVGSYCPNHRDRAALGLTGQRANTPAWKRARRRAIQKARKVCQLRLAPDCTGIATHVHHRDLDSNNDDPANLAACCLPCHKAIHQLARAAAARRIGRR